MDTVQARCSVALPARLEVDANVLTGLFYTHEDVSALLEKETNEASEELDGIIDSECVVMYTASVCEEEDGMESRDDKP